MSDIGSSVDESAGQGTAALAPDSQHSAGKHTPGPWRIDINGSDRWSVDFEGPSSSYMTICGRRTEPVAFAVEPKAYGGDVDANARLIAEAPTLAALLREVREACLYAEDDGGVGVTTEPTIDEALFGRICASLNATEGRQ